MADQEIEVMTESDSAEKTERNWKSIFQNNWNLVAIGAGILIVAILGISYYRGIRSEAEQEAGLALSRINTYVEAGDFEKALNGDPTKKVRGNDIIGLLSIVDQYSSTNAGKTAALLAANAESALQKFDVAEKHFELASGSSSLLIRASALAGLASCFEKKSDYSTAAKNYEKAVSISEHLNNKDKYQYLAASCYEKAGDKESAIKLYRNIIQEFEYSEYSGEAKAGLTRLGTIVD